MQTLLPDHRALALQRGDKPKCEIEQAFSDLEAGFKQSPKHQKAFDAVTYAKSIYDSPYKKEVLESFLLARMSPEEIEEILRIPKATTEAYGILFFDMATFIDELTVEEYIHNYPDEYGKDLKQSTLALGPDFLRFRFNRGNANIDFKEALVNLVETSYVISRAAKLNPIDSRIAREARQWMVTSMEALKTYAKVKPTLQTNTDDFKLILQDIDAAVKKKMKNPPKDPTEGLSPEDILKS